MVETLYCTTEIGAERPIHAKCGLPMAKSRERNGKQEWCCVQDSCSEARRRYEQSERRREMKRRNNARRIYIGDANGGYAGTAETPEQAAAINAHLRERLAGFKEQQREAYTNHIQEG